MPVPNLGGIAYLAKQTAKGTPASTATFAHGVTGGPIVTAALERGDLEPAVTTRARVGAVRTQVAPRVQFESYAYPKAVGLLLLAALGSDTVSGTGPYTHTLQLAGSTPYLTVWAARLAGNEKVQVSDLKVEEVEFSWDGTAPLKVSVAGTGCAMTAYNANPGTPTNDETTSAGVFVPVGGTFKVVAEGAFLATAIVTGGSVRLSGLAEPVYACNAVTPTDMVNKVGEAEVRLTLVADNLNDWRLLLTGSTTGSSPASASGYGAFEVEFKENLGTGSLKLQAGRVNFLADIPDVALDGSAFTIELSGVAYAQAVADWVKATLINQQASY